MVASVGVVTCTGWDSLVGPACAEEAATCREGTGHPYFQGSVETSVWVVAVETVLVVAKVVVVVEDLIVVVVGSRVAVVDEVDSFALEWFGSFDQIPAPLVREYCCCCGLNVEIL